MIVKVESITGSVCEKNKLFISLLVVQPATLVRKDHSTRQIPALGSAAVAMNGKHF